MEVYVDDMLVKSRQTNQHLADLAETFNTLRKYHMKLNPAKCALGVRSGKFLGYLVMEKGIEVNPEKIQAIQEMKPPTNLNEVQRLVGRIATLSRFISRSAEWSLPFFKALKKTKNFTWHEECQQAFQELKAYLAQLLLLTKPVPETSGRMVKWAIELSEYDISYQPRSAIKAQALTEFVQRRCSQKEAKVAGYFMWMAHLHSLAVEQRSYSLAWRGMN
ncbi:UNVERIFIED_CONTAM: hypothetical protein Slati_2519800 [Sesamum latifolium]|uniref:Reverse transcriptase domain-containing protein n=1 Tax=Sesamum latifolium TaxID=2727402 RepID=A0AAW2WF42_9LAMI